MKRKPNKPRPESQTHTEPEEGTSRPGASGFGVALEKGRTYGTPPTKCRPKVKYFRQKSQQEQAAASKLRMEKAGRKRKPPGKSWQSRSRPNKGPIRKAAGAAGWGRSRLCAWQALRGGAGKCRNGRGPPFGACRGGYPAAWLPVCKAQSPGASGRAASRAEARYQKAAADYHFHTAAQEHPELSKNYFYPVLAETAA